MIEWQLDENNDIVIRNGSFGTIKDGGQVAQHVRTRLLFYLGEWFLDNRSGTPWFQEVFTRPVNLPLIETIIKRRISETPELSAIIEFSMDLPDIRTRELKISFSAETSFEQVITLEVNI